MHILDVFSVFLTNGNVIGHDVRFHPHHCAVLLVGFVEERLLQNLLHLKIRLLGRLLVLVSLYLSQYHKGVLLHGPVELVYE